jgi:hypothetical protein
MFLFNVAIALLLCLSFRNKKQNNSDIVAFLPKCKTRFKLTCLKIHSSLWVSWDIWYWEWESKKVQQILGQLHSISLTLHGKSRHF